MLYIKYIRRMLLTLALLIFGAITALQAAELGKSTVDLDGKNMRLSETNYGNFVADALRHSAKVEFAMIHATAFNRDAFIKSGVISEQAILDTLPSAYDTVVILPLTRDLIKNMFEVSLSSLPASNSSFLQVSGFKVKYDSSKKFGARVVQITGKNIDWTFPTTKVDTTTVQVAVPLELGKGNAGYARLLPDTVMENMQSTKVNIITAITAEFNLNNKVIAPTIDGRLTDVAAN